MNQSESSQDQSNQEKIKQQQESYKKYIQSIQEKRQIQAQENEFASEITHKQENFLQESPQIDQQINEQEQFDTILANYRFKWYIEKLQQTTKLQVKDIIKALEEAPTIQHTSEYYIKHLEEQKQSILANEQFYDQKFSNNLYEINKLENQLSDTQNETLQQLLQKEQEQSATVFEQSDYKNIVYAEGEMMQGKFEPILFCLKKNYITIDYVLQGKNLLHWAVLQGNLQIVQILLYDFKMDVNQTNMNKSTPLMIAANYGFLEIVKLILDLGADIKARDNFRYTALLYAVSNNQLQTVLYLVYRGGNLDDKPLNKCGVAHWAAQSNNVQLLTFFKFKNVNMNQKDEEGFTPLQRAINNFSLDAVKFLIKNHKTCIDNISQTETNNIKCQAIKNFIQYELKEQKQPISLKNFYQKQMLISFMILNLIYQIVFEDKIMIIISSLLLIHSIYFMYMVINFDSFNNKKFKSNHKDEQYLQIETDYDIEQSNYEIQDCQEIQGFENIDGSLYSKMNFSVLNKFMQDNIYGQQFEITFIHILAYLVDNGRIDEVLANNFKSYCFTCQQFKKPKTEHCSTCDKCVDHFNHHSQLYQMCIAKPQHKNFMIQLILQQVSLLQITHSILCSTDYQIQDFNIFKVLYDIDILEGFSCLIYFVIISGMLFYNSIQLIIEIVGISRNLTLNELLNRQKYSYLFEPMVDYQDNIKHTFTNPSSQGLFQNTRNYLLN